MTTYLIGKETYFSMIMGLVIQRLVRTCGNDFQRNGYSSTMTGACTTSSLVDSTQGPTRRNVYLLPIL